MKTKSQEVTELIQRAVKMVVHNDPPEEVCVALTDAIEAMTELLLVWPVQDWQPIGTLPEGDYVLLRFDGLPYPVVGNSEFWSYKSGGFRATGWMRLPKL
jgi:hypothetical protein